MKNLDDLIGTQVHFLGCLTLLLSEAFVAAGMVTQHGQELVITREIINAGKDRNGHCWLDLLDDEDAQANKFGKVMFRRGPWPEGKLRLDPFDPRFREVREEQRQRAYHNITPAAVKAALVQVEADFGPLKPQPYFGARYTGERA